MGVSLSSPSSPESLSLLYSLGKRGGTKSLPTPFSGGATPRSSTVFYGVDTPRSSTGYYGGGNPEILPQASAVSGAILGESSGSSSVLLLLSSLSPSC